MLNIVRSNNCLDRDFIDLFLIAYYYFIEPQDLLDKLVEVFHKMSGTDLRKWQLNNRVRYVNLILRRSSSIDLSIEFFNCSRCGWRHSVKNFKRSPCSLTSSSSSFAAQRATLLKLKKRKPSCLSSWTICSCLRHLTKSSRASWYVYYIPLR